METKPSTLVARRHAKQYDEIEQAYEKVRAAAAELQAEYRSVCAEIDQVEQELKVLPLAPVPFEDLKAGILEFIEASGARYAEHHVKAAIAAFATGHCAGISSPLGALGKPLRYCDLDGAITGEHAAMGWAQLCAADKSSQNDQVFYYFFSELIKAGLSRVMESMTAADFGYNTIHPDKIGTDRATRRKAIEAHSARLKELQERRADIADKLRRLGCAVAAR